MQVGLHVYDGLSLVEMTQAMAASRIFHLQEPLSGSTFPLLSSAFFYLLSSDPRDPPFILDAAAVIQRLQLLCFRHTVQSQTSTAQRVNLHRDGTSVVQRVRRSTALTSLKLDAVHEPVARLVGGGFVGTDHVGVDHHHGVGLVISSCSSEFLWWSEGEVNGRWFKAQLTDCRLMRVSSSAG